MLMGHLAMAVRMHMFVEMDLFIQQDATILHKVGLVGGGGEKPRIVGNENIG